MTSNRLICISLERNMAGTFWHSNHSHSYWRGSGCFQRCGDKHSMGKFCPLCLLAPGACVLWPQICSYVLVSSRVPPCSPVCSWNFYSLSLGHPESHPVAYSVICVEVSDSQWSEVIEFTAVVLLFRSTPSYVKRFSLPGRTCCWATRADASLDK